MLTFICVHLHTCHMWMSIFVFIGIYIYELCLQCVLQQCVSVSTLCVHMCIYIHIYVYIYMYVCICVIYLCVHTLYMHSYVPVGLPGKSIVLEFPSLETIEFVRILLLYILDKSKLRGFIQKKCILQSHTVISSSLANKFYWCQFQWWIRALRMAVMRGCLIEVT